MRRRRTALVALAALSALAALATAAVQDQSGSDHRAHAKPGDPQILVDWNNDGQEEVTFDASESHSHYFNSASRARAARVSPTPVLARGHSCTALTVLAA
jgi:hypothetical protein